VVGIIFNSVFLDHHRGFVKAAIEREYGHDFYKSSSHPGPPRQAHGVRAASRVARKVCHAGLDDRLKPISRIAEADFQAGLR
jgi:hypothetical protein